MIICNLASFILKGMLGQVILKQYCLRDSSAKVFISVRCKLLFTLKIMGEGTVHWSAFILRSFYCRRKWHPFNVAFHLGVSSSLGKYAFWSGTLGPGFRALLVCGWEVGRLHPVCVKLWGARYLKLWVFCVFFKSLIVVLSRI